MTKLALPPGLPVAARYRRRPRLPLLGRSNVGSNTTTSAEVQATATASATTHTKGSWVELVAATGEDLAGVELVVLSQTNTANTDSSALLDIGVGAAGSEVVVVPDVPVGWRPATTSGPNPRSGIFPVWIPRGSRIAVRSQSAISAATVTVALVAHRSLDGGVPAPKVLAFGVNSAASKGVTPSAPAGANTKGAWTEIVSATTQPVSALVVGVQGGQDTTQATTSALLDIGVGAAGSEVVVVADLVVSVVNNESIWVNHPGFWHVDIPAGARLAARYQVANTSSSLDVILHGVPA